MCGIAGLAGDFRPELVEEMCRIVAHRGPDQEGFHHVREQGLSLGHRRLSILDPAHGVQPMSVDDGELTVVFNGEIFNAPELRAELEGRGRVFATRNSDTEVIPRLYAVHGEAMVERLNGMFAFALHDRRNRKLLLARDRCGIKPLYYSTSGGRFAFASELKALLALPWLSRRVNPASLARCLSLQYVPAPDTILAEVSKLPAGCLLSLDLDDLGISSRRYWDLAVRPDPAPGVGSWRRRVRSALENAVVRWSASDVPVACSLSGGLDSSSIVGILAGSQSGRLATYSLGFSGLDGEGIDELDLAREVARRWGTRHHEIVIDADTVLDDLDRMVFSLDEPYGGGLPSWYVFKAIGRDCKVAFTGTGGDELFGNYGKWERHEAPPEEGRRIAMDQTGRLDEPGNQPLTAAYPHGALFHRYLTDDVVRSLLADDARDAARAGAEAVLERRWLASGSDDPRDCVAFVDFGMQLPEEFLLMTDRFSMAHSVEARVPFLDNELIDLAFSIPAGLRTRPGDRKYLLREAVSDLLPEPLRAEPKRGFVLPLTGWTRGRLRERIMDVLGPTALAGQGLLSPRVWDRVVGPHLRGERDLTQQVWTLFMYRLWAERFGAH